PHPNVAHLYFARRYHDASARRYALAHPDDEAIGLLWYDPTGIDAAPLPLDAHYPTNAGLVTMRRAWNDPDASYVSLKGGRNGVPHSQLDLGTFTYEVLGHRWFTDLGRDDYNLPGYFGGRRFTYYRNRAEGHNTIVIDPGEGPDQPQQARAPTTLHSTVDGAVATVDLTEATGLAHATSTLTYERHTDTLTITDDLDAGDEHAELWWFAHARASITLSDDARAATLAHSGHQVRVTLESPEHAHFEIRPAAPLATSPQPKGQNPNDGSTILNSAKGTSFVKRGDLPAYGDPDPDDAIQKLAIHLDLTSATAIRCRIEPVR
ncbi:MAG: heparinase II/III family protein, partial [Phycisphaerales bacterium]|nr:heparinase II/III family protein [Phycisphaerales bacterium]